MLVKIKKIIPVLLAIILVAVPFVVMAQGTTSTPQYDPEVTLVNPLGQTDPRLIIGNIIKAVLSITGSIALLMFVYGGFTWITSLGEPGRVETGKKVLIWATLGLVVIASAYVAVNAIIQGLVTGSATGGV
jgi:hypothetical protein